jgi:hypothetical protein
MQADGIAPADIDRICGPVDLPVSSKPPPPVPSVSNRPPPPDSNKPPPPVSNKPPPPVSPVSSKPTVDNSPPVAASSQSSDPRFQKYEKMTKMLPEEIVRHKMFADGFSQDDINSLFPNSIPTPSSKPKPPTSGNKPPPPGPPTAAVRRPTLAPPPNAPKPPPNKPVLTLSLQEQIAQSGKNKLKKVEPVDKAPPKLSSQELLMQSLKGGGKHLRSVKDQKPIEKPEIKQSVGLMGMLSTAMLDRRGQIEVDSDGSSDGGFGSDDDDDEWGDN